MKRAVSSIAWAREQDRRAVTLLQESGVQAVEIAPSTRWPEPTKASDHEIAAEREFWRGHGFSVCALQSLLYGFDTATLFGETNARRSTLAYLERIAHLGAGLGATVLVFGSPKLRQPYTMNDPSAVAIAVDFFGRLGDISARAGVKVGLEPVPLQYGCTFATNAAQVSDLVARVGHDHVGLHFDTATAALAGDDVDTELEAADRLPWHVHCSEPELAPLGRTPSGLPAPDHFAVARALRQHGYCGYVSLEMRAVPHDPKLRGLQQALSHQRDCYG